MPDPLTRIGYGKGLLGHYEAFSRMWISDFRTVNLPHRAEFLQSTPTGKRFLVASADGHISVINDDGALDSVATKAISGVSLHPEGNIYAVIDQVSGRLQLKSAEGVLVCEIEPPDVLPKSCYWVRTDFEDCHFTETGSSFFTCARVGDGVAGIQHFDLRMVNNIVLVSQLSTIEIEDPFTESNYSFNSGGRNLFPLWITAGQDGQKGCWFSVDGQQLLLADMPSLQNSTLPEFSPSKKLFVVLDDARNVCVWSVALKKQISSLTATDENDPFESSMCFLDERHVLVGTASGRVFVIDMNSLRVLDEVVLAGHEPLPTRAYYPLVQDDDSLCTDLGFFRFLGNSIVFVHRRDKGVTLEGWVDDLIFVNHATLMEALGL